MPIERLREKADTPQDVVERLIDATIEGHAEKEPYSKVAEILKNERINTRVKYDFLGENVSYKKFLQKALDTDRLSHVQYTSLMDKVNKHEVSVGLQKPVIQRKRADGRSI